MNILVLMGKFSGGGTQRVISQLSHNLPSSYRLHMIVGTSDKHFSFSGNIQEVKLKPFTGRLQIHVHFLRFFQKLRHIQRIVREEDIDIILAVEPSWGLPGVLTKTPCIFTARNTLSYSYGKGLWQKMILSVIGKRAAAVVSVSKGVAVDLKEQFGVGTTTVIYNPVDRDRIRTLAQEGSVNESFKKMLDRKIPLVMTIGRSSKQKAHVHLLRSFAQLRKRMDCGLVLVGDGIAEDASITATIKEEGIGDDVLMLPFQKNPFVYLQHAEVFVLSSLFEGLPNVCLEAMALGVPVIATDCPSGPRELLAPESRLEYRASNIEYASHGILTPVYGSANAEELLAEAVYSLLSDEELKKRYRAAAESRSSNFDMDSFVTSWNSVFVNTCKKNSKN